MPVPFDHRRQLEETITAQRRAIERFSGAGWYRKQLARGEFWRRAGACAETAEQFAARQVAEQIAGAEATIARCEATLAEIDAMEVA